MCSGLLPSHAVHRAQQSTWQDSGARVFLLLSDYPAFSGVRNPQVARALNADWARWKEAPVPAGATYLAPCVLCPRAGAHIARRRDSFTLHSIRVFGAPLLWGHGEEQNVTLTLRQLTPWWVDGENKSVRARMWSQKPEDELLTACMAQKRLSVRSNVRALKEKHKSTT